LPSVRLSPNVRKRVRDNRGIALTLTEKPQVAERPAPSTAVHVTVEAPEGNIAPVAGVQVTVIGAAPPVAVGVE